MGVKRGILRGGCEGGEGSWVMGVKRGILRGGCEEGGS